MTGLYKLYITIDITLYGSVNDFKYIPRRSDRTVESFLNAFTTLYSILSKVVKDAMEGDKFLQFWDKCSLYLGKVGYDNPDWMRTTSDFCNSAENFWKKEYSSTDAGLEAMYKMFKVCFGITGNDDRCRYERAGIESFSWNLMRKCLQAHTEERAEFIIEKRDPSDYEWTEKSKSILSDYLEKQRRETNETETE